MKLVNSLSDVHLRMSVTRRAPAAGMVKRTRERGFTRLSYSKPSVLLLYYFVGGGGAAGGAGAGAAHYCTRLMSAATLYR